MNPEIFIIVATDKQNGIGVRGQLPWHFKKDLQYFAKLTTAHTVIMGRTTWESLPTAYKPLPDRQNIVLTTQVDYPTPGAQTARDLEAALQLATTEKVFIIGGAQVYAHALATLKNLAGIYKTEIQTTYDCDTFFPALDGYERKILASDEEQGIEMEFCYYQAI